jgi:hypothetical protein
MKKIFLISLLIISSNSMAFDAQTLKEKFRPTLETIFGTALTQRFLGEAPVLEMALPKIPQINSDARSLAGIIKERESKLKMPQEKLDALNVNFIREVYEVTRLSKPNNEEVSQWFNILSQGGSREGVYRGLVLDNVYAGLENYDSGLNEKMVGFIEAYMGKYLEQILSKENAKKMNFFTIKKLLTEKSMEVMDELYRINPQDSFTWYAVFSREMAVKYPALMNNEVRKDERAERHLNWAKNVPFQFVKSEFIIKIQTVMNHLKS